MLIVKSPSLSLFTGKKCTYGVKCKYYHPERSSQPQLSVADELRAKSQPGCKTEDFPPSAHITHQYFPLNIPSTANTTSGPSRQTQCKAALPSAYQDELSQAISGLDLYNEPRETASSLYLQRLFPVLSKSAKSDQAYGSMENSTSRLYLSDSALPTSLAYSSGCIAGSDSDYILSSSSCREQKRAHSPDIYSHTYCPGRRTLSSCQHAHSDLGINYAHTPYPLQDYRPRSSYNAQMPFFNEPLPYPHSMARQPYPRSAEVSWGQGQVEDSSKADRRKDVRSQLSTIFPQSIVDQVMSLYPHTLDTTELVALIQKYRNSHLL